MRYHYTDQNNQVVGPINEDQFHALYRSGVVSADTNVFPEGETDWRPYRSVASLPTPTPGSLDSALLTHVPPCSQPPPFCSTTKCPFCHEDISVNAKKCKHCGEMLDVALRAAEEAKRSNANPMVFMNAGGGAAAAASRPSVVVVGNQKSGLVAAFLNILLPGLGYMYCGRFFLGFFVFILTAAVVVGTAGIGALVMYPIVLIDGFLAAGRANRRMIVVT